jgi:pilus assembly protein CpaC
MNRHSRSTAIAGLIAWTLLSTASAGSSYTLYAAQAPQTPAAAATPSVPRVVLTSRRSTVLTTEFDIARVAVTDPAVADATVVGPRELLIDGKAIGTVSLIVWGNGSQRVQYDVVVEPGVPVLQQTLQLLFPGEEIRVTQTEETVILTGRVSGNDVMLRVGEVATASAPKARVINLLQLPSGVQTQQVMLQVRVAEVNRRALQEAGVALFTGPTGYKDYIARATTQQFPAPAFTDLARTEENGELTEASGKILYGDFLNLFVFNNKYNVGVLIKALEQTGHFQSLAEPNLIAYNGQPASFLAGGEIPVPIAQGSATGIGAVTIEWKEFGIRLTFTPTIAGDVIRLKVRPEVSALDFGSGVTLGGFRVPALTTRRAETDVELRDGQSFAIAGLMANSSQESRANVPVLSKIPIIGNLFKSKAENQDQTELLVLVTPQLVRPLNPDEVPPLPTNQQRFLPGKEGGTEQKPEPPRPGGGTQ